MKKRARSLKIVFTGAPSSGKTSAIQALTRLRPELVAVPETASLLLSGGFPPPRAGRAEQRKAFQRAVVAVQRGSEAMFALQHPGAGMILDRAVLDGAAYWPGGAKGFLREFRIDLDAELARYDHVVFFAQPPKKYFGGLNRTRFHDYEESMRIGAKQFAIWRRHKSFIVIPHADRFSDKLARVREVVGGFLKKEKSSARS